MNKDNLKGEFEKIVHKLVADRIKEHIVDFTVLWINKNNPEVDRASMSVVLETVRIAVDDAYYKNIDDILGKLDPHLDKFVDAANPLAHTEENA